MEGFSVEAVSVLVTAVAGFVPNENGVGAFADIGGYADAAAALDDDVDGISSLFFTADDNEAFKPEKDVDVLPKLKPVFAFGTPLLVLCPKLNTKPPPFFLVSGLSVDAKLTPAKGLLFTLSFFSVFGADVEVAVRRGLTIFRVMTELDSSAFPSLLV